MQESKECYFGSLFIMTVRYLYFFSTKSSPTQSIFPYQFPVATTINAIPDKIDRFASDKCLDRGENKEKTLTTIENLVVAISQSE